MKLSVTEQKIILGDKSCNLEDIDFIMLDKKVRLYKNNGTVIALTGGYDYYECADTFWDIAFAVAGRNNNFIILKGRVINVSNIKKLEITESGVIINTLAYELQLSDLSKKEIEILANKFNKLNLKTSTAV